MAEINRQRTIRDAFYTGTQKAAKSAQRAAEPETGVTYTQEQETAQRAREAATASQAETFSDVVHQQMEGQNTTAQQSGAREGQVIVYSGNSALTSKKGLGYTLATNIGKIADMETVTRLTGREMRKAGSSASEQIRNFFTEIGNAVFRKGFGNVSLGEYGVGGILTHRPLNRAKMVSLTAVPDVIKNGRLIQETDNWKGRGYKSYVFAAPVEIAGERVYVAAVVDQRPDNKFYLNEVVDSNGNFVRIEEIPSDGTKSGVIAQDGITATPEGSSVEPSTRASDLGSQTVQSVNIDGSTERPTDTGYNTGDETGPVHNVQNVPPSGLSIDSVPQTGQDVNRGPELEFPQNEGIKKPAGEKVN